MNYIGYTSFSILLNPNNIEDSIETKTSQILCILAPIIVNNVSNCYIMEQFIPLLENLYEKQLISMLKLCILYYLIYNRNVHIFISTGGSMKCNYTPPRFIKNNQQILTSTNNTTYKFQKVPFLVTFLTSKILSRTRLGIIFYKGLSTISTSNYYFCLLKILNHFCIIDDFFENKIFFHLVSCFALVTL